MSSARDWDGEIQALFYLAGKRRLRLEEAAQFWLAAAGVHARALQRQGADAEEVLAAMMAQIVEGMRWAVAQEGKGVGH